MRLFNTFTYRCNWRRWRRWFAVRRGNAMKKTRALCVLGALSVGYLLVQALFLRDVSKGKVEEPGPNSVRVEVERKNLGEIAYDNVREFIRVCDGLSLPVFIVDPDVLSAVMSSSNNTKHGSSSPSSSCRYLCHHMPIIGFGVMHAKVNKVQKRLEADLRSAGFSVSVYMDSDPLRLSVTSTVIPLIPTHIVLYREGHTIHLVVFVERTSGFWWHGDMSVPQGWVGDAVPTNITNLKFGAHAGAFEKMEILKVDMDGVKLNAPRYPTVFTNQIPTSTFIECNYTRAKQFHYRYPKDESPEAMLFKKKARILIDLAKSRVLDALVMPFWLSSGTCLGWFRQCDVIPYSKDVDLGMFIQHYDVRLIAAMQMNDLPLKHLFGKPEDSFELSFQGGDVKLDMFFFYEEPDHMWNGGTQARTGNKYKYFFPKFTLCWTEFLGLRVRVPCETETYIEANYGRTWFEPVRHWDWKRSPPNVRPNGRWADAEMDRVVQHFQ